MEGGKNIHESLFAIEPALGIVERVSFLCDQVAGKTVLHVGCADYPLTMQRMNDSSFLHRRLCGVSSYCVGLDASKEALEASEKRVLNI